MYAEEFSASNDKWIPGVLQKVTGPLSCQIQLHDGRVIQRYIDNVKSRSTGLVEEKGDNSEHNLPAMQNVGFEAGISSSVTENRKQLPLERVCQAYQYQHQVKLLVQPHRYGHLNIVVLHPHI